jgi:hypothetical protein
MFIQSFVDPLSGQKKIRFDRRALFVSFLLQSLPAAHLRHLPHLRHVAASK